MSGVEGESYIENVATKVRILVKKKGGSFVIEANFVKRRRVSPGRHEYDYDDGCRKTKTGEGCG